MQHAPESYRTSEELKIQVFLGGLDEDLRCQLEEFEVTTYQAFVEKARVLENANKKKSAPKLAVFNKRSFDESKPSQKFKKSNFRVSFDKKGKERQDVTCWKCEASHKLRFCPQLSVTTVVIQPILSMIAQRNPQLLVSSVNKLGTFPPLVLSSKAMQTSPLPQALRL